MDKRIAEQLFIQLERYVKKEYKEEVAMIIDVFLEDTFSKEEFQRLYKYLLEKVEENKQEQVYQMMKQKMGI